MIRQGPQVQHFDADIWADKECLHDVRPVWRSHNTGFNANDKLEVVMQMKQQMQSHTQLLSEHEMVRIAVHTWEANSSEMAKIMIQMDRPT